MLRHVCAAQEKRRLEYEKEHAAAARGALEIDVQLKPEERCPGATTAAAAASAGRASCRARSSRRARSGRRRARRGGAAAADRGAAAGAPGHEAGRQPAARAGRLHSWMPLRVACRRAELLEALTRSPFDNQEVCTLSPPRCAASTSTRPRGS